METPKPADPARTSGDPSAARRLFATAVTEVSYSQLKRASEDPQSAAAHRDALPKGFMLAEFRIESVLGIGGFGISYLAYDTLLNLQVAIKEYLPVGLGVRSLDGPAVYARSEDSEDQFVGGLQRFLAESRTLATFRHRNIVRVTRFFEANRTAYMVMDYEVGRSLHHWMRERIERGLGAPGEAAMKQMFTPLLDGLTKVHAVGFLHRDIKPANIYVRDEDGSLVLLDFGAARRTPEGTSTSGLTSIVSPGFAPFEQYHAHGRQGAWSDIYAMGGVWYWLISGEKPVEAAARVHTDPQIPATTIGAGKYSPAFLALTDRMLSPDEYQRPQDVKSVLYALQADEWMATTMPAPVSIPPTRAAALSGAGLKSQPPRSSPSATKGGTGGEAPGTMQALGPSSESSGSRMSGSPEASAQAASTPGPTSLKPIAARRNFALAAAAVAALAAIGGGYALYQRQQLTRPLRWGVIPRGARDGDPLQIKALFTPLVTELEQLAKVQLEMVIVSDFLSSSDGSAAPSYDLITAPLDQIAPMLRSHGFAVVGKSPDQVAQFLVRDDSPAKSLADLKGLRLGVQSRSTSMGPMSVQALADQGYQFPGSFASFTEMRHQDEAIQALLRNTIDVIAITEGNPDAASALANKKLRSVGTSAPFPGYGIALGPGTPPAAAERLTNAFWTVDSTPAGKDALKSLALSGIALSEGVRRTSSREFLLANEQLGSAQKLYPPPAPTAFGQISR